MNKDAIIKLVNEQLWTKGEADVPQFKACLLYTSRCV